MKLVKFESVQSPFVKEATWAHPQGRRALAERGRAGRPVNERCHHPDRSGTECRGAGVAHGASGCWLPGCPACGAGGPGWLLPHLRAWQWRPLAALLHN